MSTAMIFSSDTSRARLTRECATDGCRRARHKGSICGTCFRIKSAGLPMAESLWVARRLANVKWVGECLIWQGAPNNMGYGKVSVRNDASAPGNEEAVHRWFYKRFKGPIPEGLVLDHLCRTPLCVNIMHLEPVTQNENDLRGQIARGYGPDRTHCKWGHPWIAENLTRQTVRPGKLFPAYKCKQCDAALHRRKKGNEPRGTRTRAEAIAALTEMRSA
jgi:hypothetical protein